MKYQKTLSAAALIPVLFLAGCGLDGWFTKSDTPKKEMGFSKLRNTEIGELIYRSFPNKSEEKVRNFIYNEIKNAPSEQEVRRIVSRMGMICRENEPVCHYEGYAITQAINGKIKFPRVKHLYTASINTRIGIDSFRMNKELIKLDN